MKEQIEKILLQHKASFRVCPDEELHVHVNTHEICNFKFKEPFDNTAMFSFLHEIGHLTHSKFATDFEGQRQAIEWSILKMQELGISIPQRKLRFYLKTLEKPDRHPVVEIKNNEKNICKCHCHYSNKDTHCWHCTDTPETCSCCCHLDSSTMEHKEHHMFDCSHCKQEAEVDWDHAEPEERFEITSAYKKK